MVLQRHPWLLAAPLLLTALLACAGSGEEPTAGPDQLVRVPADFPPLPVPEDNALTPERVELGRRLFFDKRLSRTQEIACGSCHLQEHAFADPNRFSKGVAGRIGDRNAPSLANLAYGTSFFWDGGVPTLERQALGPILNPLEMDMKLAEVNARLAADPGYVDEFQRAYGRGPDDDTLTRAIASFVRTLISGMSRFDRYRRGDGQALSAAEQRGLEIFNGEKGECFHCHAGFNLTNNGYRNNGVAPADPDLGRQRVTTRPADAGKFKVPTLRNIAVTAPYMHDGGLATLEEVVEHYARGGLGHDNTDPTVAPLMLTAQDKADLVAFLKSLTDEPFLRDPRFRP